MDAQPAIANQIMLTYHEETTVARYIAMAEPAKQYSENACIFAHKMG